MSKLVARSASDMTPGAIYVSVEGQYPFWKDDFGRIKHINDNGGGWDLSPEANTLMFPALRIFKQPKGK